MYLSRDGEKVDAIQYNVTNDWVELSQDDIADFVGFNIDVFGYEVDIVTPTGPKLARPGDWVVKKVNGDLSTCSHADFIQAYDLVE